MTVSKIFYTHPIFPSKVAMIISNRSVDRLKDMGVIGHGAKFLINPTESELMTQHIECIKFDNKDNPTALHFDIDAIREVYITEIRKKREEVLSKLDFLQQRAIALGKMDAASAIEADKQALRDLTTSTNYSNITEIRHIYTRMPAILLVDYKDKYSYV
jgi:hypothetical protein